jgi:hypothetical protein
MKKIKLFTASLFLLLLCACSDMLDSIQPFLDQGEDILVGKVAMLDANPGDERIQLMGLLPYGVTQTQCKITWIDQDGQPGSIDIPIDRKNLPTMDIYDYVTNEVIGSYPYFEVMLNNMKEGEYQFTAITLDAQGNKSVPITTSGYVYGNLYRNTLSNRVISQVSATMVTENGRPVLIDGNLAYNALVVWRAFYDSQAVSTELRYELQDGTFNTMLIPTTELQTTIPYTAKYKKNGKLEWRTIFRPVPYAIDDFYTEFSEGRLPAN